VGAYSALNFWIVLKCVVLFWLDILNICETVRQSRRASTELEIDLIPN
jgi:hypothetical protein